MLQTTEQFLGILEFVLLSKAEESGSIFTRFYSQLHTSELNDGYDWGRLNLQSVTEQSSLDDFLATAELAGTEFAAGKLFIAECI